MNVQALEYVFSSGLHKYFLHFVLFHTKCFFHHVFSPLSTVLLTGKLFQKFLHIFENTKFHRQKNTKKHGSLREKIMVGELREKGWAEADGCGGRKAA